MVGADIESQTAQVLSNIRAILDAAGRNTSDVVKTTVFLTDMADFSKFNSVYQNFFGSQRPARSTIQAAALPKGARVEIDAVVSAVAAASP